MEDQLEIVENNTSEGPFSTDIINESSEITETKVDDTKVEITEELKVEEVSKTNIEESTKEVITEEIKVEEPRKRRSRSPKIEEVIETTKPTNTINFDLKFKLGHAEVFNDLLEAARYYKTNNYKIYKGSKDYPSYMIIIKDKIEHYCITKSDAIKYKLNGKRK